VTSEITTKLVATGLFLLVRGLTNRVGTAKVHPCQARTESGQQLLLGLFFLARAFAFVTWSVNGPLGQDPEWRPHVYFRK
jgi:hypothetical protein